MSKVKSTSRWRPHVTVATLIERDNHYLLVKEYDQENPGTVVYNQPAGHLEEGESLIQAAVRETLEETGWEVEVTEYLGVYRFLAPNGITYLRHGFVAAPLRYRMEQALDEGIIKAVWLNPQELMNQTPRSPMVIRLIEDYEAGKRYPLAVLNELT